MEDVIFDSFSFQANGLVLTNIDHLRPPDRNNQIEPLANRAGGVLVQSLSGTKSIVLEGYYTGPTNADAQIMYDTLMQVLNRQERPLQVPHAGGVRVYTATPENIVMSQPGGLNRLTFSLEFVVASGSSAELSKSILADTTILTATATVPIVVQGSVAARPKIELTFTSVTGGTAKTVSIRNSKDYTGLTFSRDFVTGDTIVIDSERFQVYVNGVLVEPPGRLPSWAAGSGGIIYSDTFTGRTVNLFANYTPRNQ